MGKNNWTRMTILHRSPKTQIGLEILEKNTLSDNSIISAMNKSSMVSLFIPKYSQQSPVLQPGDQAENVIVLCIMREPGLQRKLHRE